MRLSPFVARAMFLGPLWQMPYLLSMVLRALAGEPSTYVNAGEKPSRRTVQRRIERRRRITLFMLMTSLLALSVAAALYVLQSTLG